MGVPFMRFLVRTWSYDLEPDFLGAIWLHSVTNRHLRYLMSIRHSLIRSATKNFVPGRYFFVRHRVRGKGERRVRMAH
eukprot:SAG11_NODE_38386_length_252_cov_1.143791_1_plen_77_part_01